MAPGRVSHPAPHVARIKAGGRYGLSGGGGTNHGSLIVQAPARHTAAARAIWRRRGTGNPRIRYRITVTSSENHPPFHRSTMSSNAAARAAGFRDLFTNPFDLDTLERQLRALLP